MGALFLLILIVCVVVVIAKAGSKKTQPEGTLVLPKNEASKVVTPAWNQKTEPKEEAVRIYLHEPEIRGWRCPNCECENENASSSCCVCNYTRG